MKHLRKSIVISVMALVAMNFPTPIFGQTTLAIHGGMSRATIGGDDASEEGVDVDARSGIKVGASATIPIQDKFSLRLGSEYVQKGFQGDIDDDFFGIDNVSLGLNLDYIELSGLGVLNLMPSESAASVYMLAGPAVGINVKCEVVAGDGSTTVKGNCEDEDLNTKTLDLGITGGIGTEMAISEGMTFSVELLYTLGVQSFSSIEGDDIKNRAIALQVGVGFPIGK